MIREELQEKLNLKNGEYFRKIYLSAAIKDDLIEMTLPENQSPRSFELRKSTVDKFIYS